MYTKVIFVLRSCRDPDLNPPFDEFPPEVLVSFDNQRAADHDDDTSSQVLIGMLRGDDRLLVDGLLALTEKAPEIELIVQPQMEDPLLPLRLQLISSSTNASLELSESRIMTSILDNLETNKKTPLSLASILVKGSQEERKSALRLFLAHSHPDHQINSNTPTTRDAVPSLPVNPLFSTTLPMMPIPIGGVPPGVPLPAVGMQSGLLSPAGGMPSGVPLQAGGMPSGVPLQAGGMPSGVPLPAGWMPSGVPLQAGGMPSGVPLPAGGMPSGVPLPAGGMPSGVPLQAGGMPSGLPLQAGGMPSGVPLPAGGVQSGVPSPAGGMPSGVPPPLGGSLPGPLPVAGVSPLSPLFSVLGTPGGGPVPLIPPLSPITALTAPPSSSDTTPNANGGASGLLAALLAAGFGLPPAVPPPIPLVPSVSPAGGTERLGAYSSSAVSSAEEIARTPLAHPAMPPPPDDSQPIPSIPLPPPPRVEEDENHPGECRNAADSFMVPPPLTPMGAPGLSHQEGGSQFPPLFPPLPLNGFAGAPTRPDHACVRPPFSSLTTAVPPCNRQQFAPVDHGRCTGRGGGKERERVEERVPIPSDAVPRLIGKCGRTIRDLEFTSGAFFDFPRMEQVPGMKYVSVSGSPASVRRGLDLLKHRLNEWGMAPVNEEEERERKNGEARGESHLRVPEVAAGSLIGHGGNVIRSLEIQSGAVISISKRRAEDRATLSQARNSSSSSSSSSCSSSPCMQQQQPIFGPGGGDDVSSAFPSLPWMMGRAHQAGFRDVTIRGTESARAAAEALIHATILQFFPPHSSGRSGTEALPQQSIQTPLQRHSEKTSVIPTPQDPSSTASAPPTVGMGWKKSGARVEEKRSGEEECSATGPARGRALSARETFTAAENASGKVPLPVPILVPVQANVEGLKGAKGETAVRLPIAQPRVPVCADGVPLSQGKLGEAQSISRPTHPRVGTEPQSAPPLLFDRPLLFVTCEEDGGKSSFALPEGKGKGKREEGNSREFGFPTKEWTAETPPEDQMRKGRAMSFATATTLTVSPCTQTHNHLHGTLTPPLSEKSE
uniref:K Homology domain-containing protein n=1 Tax=Chromera velia CCMP2878 TaxID=1169474 RepID=A0A0G4I1T1_9ALVE|eukprot:Cvel_10200.t1-p1 / transcript=Cvel_10200.t1 / gene=Cvel_10200 / organism=Chromera_velia_CCMP2878 / gene_product=Formin-2, putative / transcript_product=Formin-2, putative / location=Cvel_scaffold610:32726-39143(-) / protein_length=1057 / sequence_SO=supercontig / SO=protein_coding / is_pseudo=false